MQPAPGLLMRCASVGCSASQNATAVAFSVDDVVAVASASRLRPNVSRLMADMLQLSSNLELESLMQLQGRAVQTMFPDQANEGVVALSNAAVNC